MTYNVFGGTLNFALSIYSTQYSCNATALESWCIIRCASEDHISRTL